MAAIIQWKSKLDSDHEEALQLVSIANKLTLEEKALQALDINKAFLSLASPTNAQLATQLKALTRQSSGVIRLLLNKLDSTD